MLDCNINNAIIAINAFDNSQNTVRRNTFDNNLYGIFVDFPEPVLPTDPAPFLILNNSTNVFTNSGTLLPILFNNNPINVFTKSLGGIYLNNAGSIVIDQPNSFVNTKFLNINCGIFSTNTSLNVNNAYFENIIRQNYTFNGQTINVMFGGVGVFQRSIGTNINTLNVNPSLGVSNAITFKNCVTGISFNHSHATIKKIGFENVGIGVLGNRLADTKVLIDKNTINALRFGIHLSIIDHVQHIAANNNNINIKNGRAIAGIFMSAFAENAQGNLESNIKIQANSIKVSNGINGIQLTNIFHPKVNSNKVYRNTISPLMISYEWAGIKSEACDRADISCNEILPGVSEIQNNGGADIHISQRPNTWLAANIANGGAYKGIEFQGASNNSTVQTNIIKEHNIGLYYGTSAFVGPQPANSTSSSSANKWIGPFSDLNYDHPAAVNRNIWDNSGTTPVLDLTTIAQNQFRVNGTSGQDPFYPENYPDNNLGTNWFGNSLQPNLPPFTGGYCITSPVGNNGSGGGVSNNTGVVTNVGPYMAVAEGSVSSTQYSPETEWMLKKELLKILAIEDSLRNSNETLFFFYNNSTNDNIKELLKIEERLRTENEIITINRYLMNLNDSILSVKDSLILTNFILANDSSQQEYAMEQINTLNQEYITIQQENRQLLNQITQIRQDSVLISEQRNIEFSPNNFNEYLLKQVNEVYFKSYAKGLDTLTNNDIEILENIIHICPQAGGSAVYKARALYATVNDSIVYEDSTVCSQIGYYRTIKDEIETKIIEAKKEISLSDKSTENVSFSLFPNPVKDKLTVKINGEIETGIVKIIDALGKTIFQQDIKKNQKEIFIDANSISDGYYILQIATSNYIGNQKFIK